MTSESDILAFLADTEFRTSQEIGRAFRTTGKALLPHLQALKRNKLVVEVDNDFAITAKGLATIPPGLRYVMPTPTVRTTAIEHRAKLVGERKARERTFLARLAQHTDFLSSAELAELTADLWDEEQRPRRILHDLKIEGKAEIRTGGNKGNHFRLTEAGRREFGG